MQGDLPAELMEALKKQARSSYLGGGEDSDEEDPAFDPDADDSAEEQTSGEQQQIKGPAACICVGVGWVTWRQAAPDKELQTWSLKQMKMLSSRPQVCSRDFSELDAVAEHSEEHCPPPPFPRGIAKRLVPGQQHIPGLEGIWA